MIVYFIIPIICLILVSVPRLKKINLVITTFILITFSACRSPFVDRDYLNYYYLWFNKNVVDILSYYFTEPLSKLIFQLVKLSELPYLYALFIFSLLSISMKIYSVDKLKCNMYIFLSIYLGYFFYQHEFTQIRVALALGFYFISLIAVEKKIRWLFILCSIFSHTSAVFLLIGRIKFLSNKKVLIFLIVFTFFAYLLSVLGMDISFIVRVIVNNIPLFDKYIMYFQSTWGSQKINIFSVTNISFLFLTILCFFLSLKFKINNDRLSSFCLYSILGLLFIPLFSSIPVISFRISQIFLIFIPVYISYFYTLFIHEVIHDSKVKILTSYLVKVIFLMYCFLLIYIVVIHVKLLNPYSFLIGLNGYSL